MFRYLGGLRLYTVPAFLDRLVGYTTLYSHFENMTQWGTVDVSLADIL